MYSERRKQLSFLKIKGKIFIEFNVRALGSTTARTENGERVGSLESSLNGGQRTKQKIPLRWFYVPMALLILYAAVAVVYFLLVASVGSFDNLIGTQGKALAFVTSPFNFLEDFTGPYGSFIEGYFYNLIFTTGIIYFIIFYYHLISESKRISPELIFLTSIAASYVVALASWAITGRVSAGTSIIGFSMVTFLFGLTLADLRAQLKGYPHSRLRNGKLFVIAPTTFVSLILALSYLWGNTAYPFHLAGGAFCGIFILLKTKMPWKKHTFIRSPHKQH
jgi:hypothetical protein